MPAKDHRIVESDIAAPEIYARERSERRRALIPTKRIRRIEVGPYATFYFENFDTMLAQVHEMLHTEKGGQEQIAGEPDAFAVEGHALRHDVSPGSCRVRRSGNRLAAT